MTPAIFQSIERLSSPVHPKEAWSFLPPSRSFRRLSISNFQLVEQLRRLFSDDELVAARVLVRQSNGGLALNNVLGGDVVCGLFVRDTRDGIPVDIVNQRGSLATSDPPAFNMARDHFAADWRRDNRMMFVTFSGDDLAVMRLLGFPCAPSAGLATMNGRQFARLLGDSRHSLGGTADNTRPAAIATADLRLVLVGWHVAELRNEPPDELRAIVAHIQDADAVYALPALDRVAVWRPSGHHFDRIATAVRFRDRRAAQEMVRQSIHRCPQSVRSFIHAERRESDATYLAAHERLRRELARAPTMGSLASTELRSRLERTRQTFEQDVIAPMMRDALAADNPTDRALQIAAAELARQAHESSPLIRSTADVITGGRRSCTNGSSIDELKEHLRIVDTLIKVARQTRQI